MSCSMMCQNVIIFGGPLVILKQASRHAQTFRDRASSYNIDYVIVIKSFLNPEGHQHPISGSKVTAILLKGWIWPIGEASAGEGLRLQPAQQACSLVYISLCLYAMSRAGGYRF